MIDTRHLITRRTHQGLSQRQLAKLTGVNRETIGRLERGADPSRLPLAVISRLATALDTPLADLLTQPPAAQDHDPLPDTPLDPTPLDHNAARLLRRIHRGDDIRRTMTRTDRELTLPNLLRRGLVTAGPDGIHVAESATRCFDACTSGHCPEGRGAGSQRDPSLG